jgi:hypothetical protein
LHVFAWHVWLVPGLGEGLQVNFVII